MELLKAIEAEAEKRCAGARERAEAEVRRIEAETEEQIHAKREAEREASQRRLEAEERVVVSQAETKLQRERAVAKSELVSQVMAKAREGLARIAASEEYGVIFRSLAAEATAEIKEDFTAVVRPEDASLARKTLEELGAKGFEVATDGRFAGGLVVVSRDGRSRVVNTLDARFDRIRDEAVLRIGPLLFG